MANVGINVGEDVDALRGFTPVYTLDEMQVLDEGQVNQIFFTLALVRHAADPNCETVALDDTFTGLRTKRQVAAGEELTIRRRGMCRCKECIKPNPNSLAEM